MNNEHVDEVFDLVESLEVQRRRDVDTIKQLSVLDYQEEFQNVFRI
jgi:hypothetical protein